MINAFNQQTIVSLTYDVYALICPVERGKRDIEGNKASLQMLVYWPSDCEIFPISWQCLATT